ncbi:MAG TPA: DUF6798 domain-containing protein [Pirellulaceae bacterium]|nr:DUF6798 domain-containing protein [Pirellulaceae bacterium]
MRRPAASATLFTLDANWRLAAFEVVWIFLIFFLVAGSQPPDVGESHYLVKAKHYWQPAWCAGDLFCESHDAHGVFYWTLGWVTRIASLTATAWIGRAVTWGLLAWSWRRLSWALVPQPLVSLLSAGLMLLLLRNFHLAGEWIVGGVEAKGFAYVLVFLALEAIVRGSWRAALLLAGAAGAFHVLVGGWTVVAIGAAWLLAGKERPAAKSLLPAAIGGLVLSLPGLLPALLLNRGTDGAVSVEAARIYVFERLPHHLVYHRFTAAHIWRFAALVAAWLALAIALRGDEKLRRLNLVVAGAALLGLIGVALDQSLALWAKTSAQTAEAYEQAAAPLLRYYWFRLSDSFVPIGAALAIVAGLQQLQAARPAWASWLSAAAILLAGANVADVYYWRHRQPLPGAILQSRPTADAAARWWHSPRAKAPPGEISARAWFRDWQAVCTWIDEHTPKTAKFVTPREQQTFKWYAGRAEVANWKDVPQDARGILEWKAAMQALRTRTDLAQLARDFGAQYVLIDTTRTGRPQGLRRIYPLAREENPTFEVYRLPEPLAP